MSGFILPQLPGPVRHDLGKYAIVGYEKFHMSVLSHGLICRSWWGHFRSNVTTYDCLLWRVKVSALFARVMTQNMIDSRKQGTYRRPVIVSISYDEVSLLCWMLQQFLPGAEETFRWFCESFGTWCTASLGISWNWILTTLPCFVFPCVWWSASINPDWI